MGVRGCLVPWLEDLQAKGEGNAVCQRVEDQCQAVGLLGQTVRCQLLQPLLLDPPCPVAWVTGSAHKPLQTDCTAMPGVMDRCPIKHTIAVLDTNKEPVTYDAGM